MKGALTSTNVPCRSAACGIPKATAAHEEVVPPPLVRQRPSALGFVLLLALAATHGERKGAQTGPRDLFATRCTLAVDACFEPRDRLVEAAEGLGSHLDQCQLDVFLDINLRHFPIV